MNHLQATKVVALYNPAAASTTGAYTTVACNRTGFDTARIVVQLGAIAADMTALKLTESDDDSSYSDVTGLVFGTSSNIAGSTSALPTTTTDEAFYVFDVDLRPRKKYIKLAATAGTNAGGTYMSALAILSRAHTVPDTASEMGASQVLRA
jgi:hypothetical protein